MANIVVHCGLCGHALGVLTDVERPPDEDQLRELVGTHVPETMKCPRCHSTLVGQSGTLGVDSTRVDRAVAAEAINRQMRGGTRFAVGTPDGAHSSVWRVWAYRSDVYVAARSIVSEMRVSLHASGKWRAAFTEKHLKRPQPFIDPSRDRAVDKWERPPEFAPGWTRGFMIIVPVSEVVEGEEPVAEPQEVVWFPRPADGFATYFDVLLAAPGATGSEGRGFAAAKGYESSTEVVTNIELENGERLWVVAHSEPMTQEKSHVLEETRARIFQLFRDRIAQIVSGSEPHDLRAFGAGHSDDGLRFYVDIAIRDSGDSDARAAATTDS